MRWNSEQLSENSGVSTATIKRLKVMEGVTSVQVRMILALKESLELAGFEFIATAAEYLGVRSLNKRI